MVDLPAVIVTGTITDHVIEDDTDPARDHVNIVVNIATDHPLHTAVDHHLRTNENVDPDHKNAEQSLSKISIFLLCARPATSDLLLCSHISAT